MRCLDPRNVGFMADGKTICWSQKKASKQFASFQLPCGQCIECRLEYARMWAVRCVHESKMHDDNSFITLTYSDKHLRSPWLIYEDFQLFIERLRYHNPTIEIPFKVTGEYGEQTKRPHWHALLFNYRPKDLIPMYKNDNGDQLYRSASLDEIWGKNNPDEKPTEVGQINFKSAGYVMRYAAKKLVHGHDKHHPYQPISKGSSKYAIGKSFLEAHRRDIFGQGKCILEGGATCGVPRYYEKWLLKHYPSEWEAYVTRIKLPQIEKATNKAEEEKRDEWKLNDKRRALNKTHVITKTQIRKILIDDRFERLQKHLKGDL